MENRLPPGQQIVGPDRWPFVGEREPLPPPEIWTLTLTHFGVVVGSWTLAELKLLPQTTKVVDIHCVTRWSKLDVTFVGVTICDLLAAAGISDAAAQFISFVAHSQRNHSTSLQLAEAIEQQTLIAWEFDGQPLSTEHGGPLRNIVPGKYFYKSVKWLRQIDLLAEDRLGYWESDAGYHNHADPWQEERYLAPDLDRRQARQLMESRDFAGKDLRGIRAEKLDLVGLNAEKAILRDAHFENARLQNANFQQANLSNSHFVNADLRNARFRQADLEGADLAGADLRGADFTDASFFGASFVTDGQDEAIIDPQCLSETQLAALTQQQSDWVRRQR